MKTLTQVKQKLYKEKPHLKKMVEDEVVKLKQIANPCVPLCQGCVFDKKRKCGKPFGIEPSCCVRTNSGTHMGIIVKTNPNKRR